jgi:hypothetical protein
MEGCGNAPQTNSSANSEERRLTTTQAPLKRARKKQKNEKERVKDKREEKIKGAVNSPRIS